MSLEHWMHISDELDPLLASGSDASSTKRNKTFDIDSGRLTVKTKWVKISDSDVGDPILKVLNLSSTNVGKYFLKIDVKLTSNFQRMLTESEQKTKSHEVTSKSKEPHVPSSAKRKKTYSDRKISEMLPKITKEQHDSSALFNDAIVSNSFNDENAEDLSKFEEYVPVPTESAFLVSPPTYNPSEKCSSRIRSEYSPPFAKAEDSMEDIPYDPTAGMETMDSAPIYNPSEKYSPTIVKAEIVDAIVPYEPTSASSIDCTSTYSPEKNVARIESNQIKSEYSPTFVNADKSPEEIKYKPTAKTNKSSETDKAKKLSSKKTKELFGSSDDENYDDDRNGIEKVASTPRKSKRQNESSPRRDKKSSKERSKSKKKKTHNVQRSRDSSIGDISIR